MRSIEVLGCMVASALPRNNPYLGQAYRYRMPVAPRHQALTPEQSNWRTGAEVQARAR
jgi:hypothetical protein